MRYQVKTLHELGQVVAIEIDAANEGDAIRQAKQQGLEVISAKPESKWHHWGNKRKTHFDVVLFTQELLALLNAGLALVEAVEALAEKESRGDTKQVLEKIIAAMYEGQPFSQALHHFPALFSELYIATVRASEKTGDMAESLDRYVHYQLQLNEVRKKIISAAIYPLVLMGFGGLVMIFLLGYLVPKFSKIYEDIGGELPLPSRLLMLWGRFVEGHAEWLLLAIIAIGFLLYWVVARKQVKEWIVGKLWQIKAIGQRLRIFQLARFYRSTGMLLKGGIPVVTALTMVSGLLHCSLREPLQRAIDEIKQGQQLSQTMARYGLTTPVAVRMLRVGERTGKMGHMMERIAQFYDEDMARWVDWFTRLFEPILMIFIGLFIGTILILMYMPIFELAGAIQ